MADNASIEEPAFATGVVITATAHAVHPAGAVVPDVSEEDE
jgi:hypothetical protein